MSRRLTETGSIAGGILAAELRLREVDNGLPEPALDELGDDLVRRLNRDGYDVVEVASLAPAARARRTEEAVLQRLNDELNREEGTRDRVVDALANALAGLAATAADLGRAGTERDDRREYARAIATLLPDVQGRPLGSPEHRLALLLDELAAGHRYRPR